MPLSADEVSKAHEETGGAHSSKSAWQASKAPALRPRAPAGKSAASLTSPDAPNDLDTQGSDEHPTSPRQSGLQEEPAAPGPAPSAASPDSPAGEKMPSQVEDPIATFLSNVAEITPPPVRERQENVPPAFFVPNVSPEEAERKKARAQPFISEMQTVSPAFQDISASPEPGDGPQHPHRRSIWSGLIAVLLLLAVLATMGPPHLGASRSPAQQATPAQTVSVAGPTPTPVALKSRYPLLTESAPGCTRGSQGFWSFVGVQKSCAANGVHVTNSQRIPAVIQLLSINGGSTDPDNVVVVQVMLLAGQRSDQVGLVTRYAAQQGYVFSIDANRGWQVFSWGQDGSQKRLIGSGSSAAIHPGLQVLNTLEVVSKGNHFAFYVNQVWVYSFSDSAYPSGHVGLVVNGGGDQAAFSNFALYDVPPGA